MDEMKKKEAKDLAQKILTKISLYGFWALLVTGAGFWGGITYANNQQSNTTASCITLGGFVYKGVPYEITPKPVPATPIPVVVK